MIKPLRAMQSLEEGGAGGREGQRSGKVSLGNLISGRGAALRPLGQREGRGPEHEPRPLRLGEQARARSSQGLPKEPVL